MATTYRNALGKHSTGVYYYCFRLEGRQFKGSTHTKDLVIARRVLAQKKDEARDLLAQEAKSLGLKGRSEPPSQQPSVPTVSELLRAWLEIHRPTVSESHLRSVEQVGRNWLLPFLGDSPIDQIGAQEVLTLRSRILASKRSPSTANHVGRVLSLLWNFAVVTGFLKHLPFKVKPLRVQRKPRAILPAVRVQEFLAAVDERVQNPQVRVILRVQLGLGMRASEVLGMRWEWFNAEQQTYTVGKAKGKEARVIPVPSWLWEAIHALPRISDWVFPANDGQQRRPQFARMPLMRVCKRLGLPNMTQHRLRASFASLHAAARTPLTELQGMLGHKNITTTMIYVEQTLESKRKAQDALSQKLGLA
jgi:integrase